MGFLICSGLPWAQSLPAKKEERQACIELFIKAHTLPAKPPCSGIGPCFLPELPMPFRKGDMARCIFCSCMPLPSAFYPPPTKLGLGICVLISAVTLAGMLYEKGIFPQGAPKYWEDTKGWLSAMVFATRPLPKPQSRKAQRGASAASSILAKRTAFLRTMEEGIS